MSQSIRHIWPEPFQGTHWLNLDLPGLVVSTGVPRRPPHSTVWTHDHVVSAVAVTVAEWNPEEWPENDTYIGDLHRGDAIISVSNVRPYVRFTNNDPPEQGGGVEFVITVDYFTPLLIATTITVFDELPRISR